MTSSTTFLEHEHKFLVGADFDLADFTRRVEALGACATKALAVRDTYFAVAGKESFAFRHRLDAELQQLTVKSRAADSETRLEVNLDLATGGDQLARVEAFLRVFGRLERFEIAKEIHVFDFDDCEIVHYVARHGGLAVYCVEFEAKTAPDRAAALAVIRRYEQALGFDDHTRTGASLFDLLVAPGAWGKRS